jgi:hypothetical protein
MFKPLKFILLFNVITVLLFVTAPFYQQADSLFLFLLFVSCTLFFLAVGYRIGVSANIAMRVIPMNYFFVIGFNFIFYALTFYLKYTFLMKMGPTDFVGMLAKVSLGLASPDLGYKMTLEEGNKTIPWSLYFVTSIFNQLFFMIGIVLWNKLRTGYKFAFVLFSTLELVFWFSRGTNFGIIVMIVNIFIYNFFIRNESRNVVKWRFIIGLPLIAILAFMYNMISRRGDNDFNLYNFAIGSINIDPDGSILTFIPDFLIETYIYVVSYLGQGYYHTILAFNLDYVPTFFLGNNSNLLDFTKLFGVNLYENTYVFRLSQYGVDPEVNWHSAYTWIASDTTFFLMPVLFLFIGYIYGLSWKLISLYNDFVSKLIFMVLSTFLIFLFANNNFISSVFYSVTFLFPYWFFTRFLLRWTSG